MTESPQGLSEDWLSLVNLDSPFPNSFNQQNQQEALGWIDEFNTSTYGSIDLDHQAGQQAQGGLSPPPDAIGDCIVPDVVNSKEELERPKQRVHELDTQ